MQAAIKPTDQTHLHFVTGKLASASLNELTRALSQRHGFDYSIQVMPITVAALMTPKWIVPRLELPQATTHLVVPGFCESDIDQLRSAVNVDVIVGPKDFRDLGVLFGEQRNDAPLDDYDIEIIAEINHAPRLTLEQFIATAKRLISEGADRIDIGCDPTQRCETIADYVAALTAEKINASIDTFDPLEAADACRAGASLVLSVNSSNREQAVRWDAEVVVVPDSPNDLDSMDQTITFLDRHGVSMRLDPILEPIGTGFADSLVRYHTVRARYPEFPMMMGIGNLTELTDVDSAGVNLMLLGFCQELRIRSILTTQVINWARSSVRECDHARRMVYHAVKEGIPPKNLSGDLVMLRDRKVNRFAPETLDKLAGAIRDNNYRMFAQEDLIHLVSRELHLCDDDPFRLFDRLLGEPIADNVDRGHAFYLGYEMAKASIALALGKQYDQDRALDWGMLTVAEDMHRIARTSRHRSGN